MAQKEINQTQQHYSTSYGGNLAENYERFFVSAIGEPLARDIIDLAGLKPGERVLDVACGTGIIARLAAEQVGGTVTGLDINPGMLAVARKTVSPNNSFEWYEASAEEMPLADESFDVVLSQAGLQFVPDKLRALNEMYRVLVPGGRLYLNVPGRIAPVFSIFADAIERHAGAEAAGFARHVFSLHETDVLERLIVDAGFKDVEVRVYDKEFKLPAPKEFLWQYVYSTPLADVIEQIDEERRNALEEEVVAISRLVERLENRLEGIDLEDLLAAWEEDDPKAAAIEVQRRNIERIRAEMMPLVLHAPVSGQVAAIHKMSGEYVDQGEMILQIHSPQPDYIVAHLRHPIITKPEPGMEVLVRKQDRDRSEAIMEIANVGVQLETIEEMGMLFPDQPFETRGLPVRIAINYDLDLTPGEVVDMRLMTR